MIKTTLIEGPKARHAPSTAHSVARVLMLGEGTRTLDSGAL